MSSDSEWMKHQNSVLESHYIHTLRQPWASTISNYRQNIAGNSSALARIIYDFTLYRHTYIYYRNIVNIEVGYI